MDSIDRCVTSDLKKGGNPLYLVGITRGEMGGSCLHRRFGGKGGQVPGVEIGELRRSMDLLLTAMERGMVKACHDCSDGGLAVTMAEMCMGGDIGCRVDLAPLGEIETVRKLFCESNSRWVVEVEASMEDEWRRLCPSIRLGEVGGGSLAVTDTREVIELTVQEMRETWASPLWRILG